MASCGKGKKKGRGQKLRPVLNPDGKQWSALVRQYEQANRMASAAHGANT